eukprot:NODE_6674_length_1649_cov_9.680026.p1 GENE.NODE_6674_length_1649_cov_9.680026~~NODE_6674_length_1649_cov_9.680026.p1  ORF type:complete len:457 (-),score=129.84 NODE_6674_length_1649_cov_9.680026:206-1576(-)
MPLCRPDSFLYGFAGINGGVFGAAPFVNKSIAPGETSQENELGLKGTLKQIVTLRYLFMTPNLVWILIALGLWFALPYDIAAFRDGYPLKSVLLRLAVNFAYAFAYYAFFFVTLYQCGLAQRKYSQKFPTPANMAHDLYYWFLGVMCVTVLECIMLRLWATGAVPYVTNEALLGSAAYIAVNVVWALIVPILRDMHFYAAHRLIHVRCIFQYVHKLHHRDSDPEPFSGMCMHPVEHLLYFSNAFLPALFLPGLSPFIFMYTVVHLVLAPAAGHSGWEDHFQADQYHYIHHAKFECNYGSPFSAFIDIYMGTFREKLGASAVYRGPWLEKDGGSSGVWSPQGRLGFQTDSNLAFTLFCLGVAGFAYWAVVHNTSADAEDRITNVGPVTFGTIVGLVTTVSPILFAALLCRLRRDPFSWRWPFQDEKLFGSFAFFGVAGIVACIVPVHLALQWVCDLQ